MQSQDVKEAEGACAPFQSGWGSGVLGYALQPYLFFHNLGWSAELLVVLFLQRGQLVASPLSLPLRNSQRCVTTLCLVALTEAGSLYLQCG